MGLKLATCLSKARILYSYRFPLVNHHLKQVSESVLSGIEAGSNSVTAGYQFDSQVEHLPVTMAKRIKRSMFFSVQIVWGSISGCGRLVKPPIVMSSLPCE